MDDCLCLAHQAVSGRPQNAQPTQKVDGSYPAYTHADKMYSTW